MLIIMKGKKVLLLSDKASERDESGCATQVSKAKGWQREVSHKLLATPGKHKERWGRKLSYL